MVIYNVLEMQSREFVACKSFRTIEKACEYFRVKVKESDPGIHPEWLETAVEEERFTNIGYQLLLFSTELED